AEGTIDVQSHTLTHAMVFTSRALVGFVQPGYDRTPLLARPLLSENEGVPSFVTESDLGAPLYEQRSRMSDGLRMRPSLGAHEACVRLVRSEGSARFFSEPNWRQRLDAIVQSERDTRPLESADEHRRTIERELDAARSCLNERLGAGRVNHVCLPSGVSGKCTELALKRLGFATAVANRMTGVHAVRPGDDPHWLKRLPNRYI